MGARTHQIPSKARGDEYPGTESPELLLRWLVGYPKGAMAHVARYLAPEESPSATHFEALEQLTNLLQPGWQDVEIRRQRLAGMVVAHDFPSYEARGQRGPIMVPDAPGLFLAGDWVGAEGMLSDASAASARAAARAVGEYCEQSGNAVSRLRLTRRGD